MVDGECMMWFLAYEYQELNPEDEQAQCVNEQ